MFSLLIMLGVGAFLFYFFVIKKRETDNPVMRKFYGYSDGETLARMWPNGLFWLRQVSDEEKALNTAGTVAGALLGFQVRSKFDTFVLSLTSDGVFIINDNRKEDNIGTVRFRQSDIQSVTRLHQKSELVAGQGFGELEASFDVELTLKNGNTYWIQIPQSAYEALTGTPA